jgi:hypothetical protein
MRSRLVAASAAAAALLAAAPAVLADETTFCNTYITSLPYTITVQGHYCFNRNLSTPITSGNAITINASYVVLDMNNFKLGGGAAGPGTTTRGIYAIDRSNVTVRGGNIRGFAIGIQVTSTVSTLAQNVTIENNVVDANTMAGIVAFGTAIVIRDNVLTENGFGSTAQSLLCNNIGGGILILGDLCGSGQGVEIVRNTLVRTGGGPNDNPVGITGWDGIVKDNVNMYQFGGVAISGTICRDNTVFRPQDGAAAYDCETLVGNNANVP